MMYYNYMTGGAQCAPPVMYLRIRVCGQILQKILAWGRAPPPFLAMPGFWEHLEPQPLPNAL